MSAPRWPTDRLTFQEPHRSRPWWRDSGSRGRFQSALYVLLVAAVSVLVLGVLIPALWTP